MIRFCPACGAPLAAAPPTTCEACGTALWANAKPCAAALVVDPEGRVLLTRRAHAPWLGRWCAPSGFCDGPEHPIAAAEREAREEAGLAVRVTGYLGTWVDPYADEPAGADAELVSVAYYHAVLDGPSRARPVPHVDPAEASEAGWFAPDALPAPLAPTGSGPAIYAAWRDALAAGDLAGTLRDRP